MVSNIEVEASQFARIVEEIEKLIRDGGQAGPGYPLAAVLGSAQGRLDSLHAEEEHAAVEKKEKEEKDRSAIAAMVERETKLNEEEKKKYAEFLSKDHFTKSDFGDLSRFYADGGAYDRLSDEGKAQMSQRIQEGIDRGEFTRDELPSDVRAKDAETRRDLDGKFTLPASRSMDRPPSPKPVHSEIDTSKLGDELKSKTPETKNEVSDVLAGLSKISPVSEADEALPPHTGKSGAVREIGG